MALPDWEEPGITDSEYKNRIDATAQDHEDRIGINESGIAVLESRIGNAAPTVGTLITLYEFAEISERYVDTEISLPSREVLVAGNVTLSGRIYAARETGVTSASFDASWQILVNDVAVASGSVSPTFSGPTGGYIEFEETYSANIEIAVGDIVKFSLVNPDNRVYLINDEVFMTGTITSGVACLAFMDLLGA